MFEDGTGWQAQLLQMMTVAGIEQLTAKHKKHPVFRA